MLGYATLSDRPFYGNLRRGNAAEMGRYPALTHGGAA